MLPAYIASFQAVFCMELIALVGRINADMNEPDLGLVCAALAFVGGLFVRERRLAEK